MSLKDAARKRVRRDNTSKAAALQEVQKEPMKRLNVNIPESMHQAFKIKCTEQHQEMGDVIREFIDTYLSK